jgi:hypothetical protein
MTVALIWGLSHTSGIPDAIRWFCTKGWSRGLNNAHERKIGALPLREGLSDKYFLLKHVNMMKFYMIFIVYNNNVQTLTMYVQYLHVHVPMNSKQLGLGFYLFLCVR